MDDGATFTVDTHEVDEWLTTLPDKFRGQITKRALQMAGDVMLVPMKALCPVRTDESEQSGNNLAPGVLKESLTTQVQVNKFLPPRVKVGAPYETARVLLWIENGFDNVRAKKHISGKHFVAASFDESWEKAVDMVVTQLETAMNEQTGSV